MLDGDGGDAEAHVARRALRPIDKTYARFDDHSSCPCRARQEAGVCPLRPLEPDGSATWHIRSFPFGHETADRFEQLPAPLLESCGEPPHERIMMPERQEERHGTLVVGG